jgi:hypothetical protein
MCYPRHHNSIFCILPPHVLTEIAKTVLRNSGMLH